MKAKGSQIKYLRKKVAAQKEAATTERAKAFYFKYAMSVIKGSAPGNVFPVWEDLSPSQKNGWMDVAKEAVR